MKDCDCTQCAYSKKHPQLNAPRCWHVTADTITDEQIRELWRKGLINHDDADALKVGAARKAVDDASVAAVLANPDGNAIEHLNHALLEKAHELGRTLVARARCAELINQAAHRAEKEVK